MGISGIAGTAGIIDNFIVRAKAVDIPTIGEFTESYGLRKHAGCLLDLLSNRSDAIGLKERAIGRLVASKIILELEGVGVLPNTMGEFEDALGALERDVERLRKELDIHSSEEKMAAEMATRDELRREALEKMPPAIRGLFEALGLS